jgi:hypothetical protein
MLFSINQVQAFTSASSRPYTLISSLRLRQNSNDDTSDTNDQTEPTQSRREAIQSAVLAASVALSLSTPTNANAFTLNLNPFQPLDQISNGGKYEPARRATAYLVDATIPPTLVPFRASREAAILKQIGSGLGTQKSPFIGDKLTLNNMMNKGVFGAIDLVKGLVGTDVTEIGEDGETRVKDDKKNRAYDASFVFMGMDYNDGTNNDAELAVGLMTDIIKPRRGFDTALALGFVPLSMQSALDSYMSSSDVDAGGGNNALDTLTQTLVEDHLCWHPGI